MKASFYLKVLVCLISSVKSRDQSTLLEHPLSGTPVGMPGKAFCASSKKCTSNSLPIGADQKVENDVNFFRSLFMRLNSTLPPTPSLGKRGGEGGEFKKEWRQRRGKQL
ncbi:MAG: hypothetical protein D6748_11125 [Calditrichaeota bacterium]|nr:MAG: hypothetical protein D6748_11125 [Calditrichota bacterium]